MQRLVENLFTLLVGTLGVLFICAAVFSLIAGSFGYMVAGAIGSAVCTGWVQQRTPVQASITLKLQRSSFADDFEYDDLEDEYSFSDVEPCDCEDCNGSRSIYPFSET